MSPVGEMQGNARLTEDDVREIRRRAADGELQRVLAAEFGVSRWTITDAISGRNWGHLGKPRLAPESTLWTRLVVDEDDCWLWTGRVNRKGYGEIHLGGRNGRTLLTHRLAWMLTYGDPGGLCVLHHCDKPACCNPRHLWLGTRADNNRDMRSKGRLDEEYRISRLPRGDAHKNGRKTHCIRGHEFTPENTYYRSRGDRQCLECRREYDRHRHLAAKEAG